MLLEDEVTTLTRGMGVRDETIARLQEEAVGLEARAEKLQLLVKVSDDIRALRVSEFEELGQSNRRVADGINSLVSDLERIQTLQETVDSLVT